MPSKARGKVIDESVVGAYHVWSRMVRRAFLAGIDPVTRRDFRHRKKLLRRRLALLASVFAVECLDFAILDNHLHLILRNRPDLVEKMTDEEVAERWLRLQRAHLELLPPPTADMVAGLVADTARLIEIRQRFSGISWFMAYLKEPLARRFNIEDDVTGHLWAARFGCAKLEDDVSILSSSLYAAMNPYRAGIATSVETSEHTSMFDRLQDRKTGDPLRPESGDLAAVHVDGDGYEGAGVRRRPSDKGYLGLTFDEYLELVDVLIRQERAQRAGEVLSEVPSVLARLGISTAEWEASLRLTSRRFLREFEVASKLRAEAERMRQR